MADRLAPVRRQRLAAVLVVVALVVVAWGGDVLARHAAESLVARDVQAATGVAEIPAVDIGGRFFLPQVVRGAYDDVHVQVRGVTSGPLVVERAEADLSDVRVPFHDVLVRDVRTVGVGHSAETALLTYPALNAYLDATGRPVRVAAAPGGRGLVVSGTVTVLDRRITASADVTLSVADGNLRLVPGTIDTGGTTLGGTAQLLLGQRLSLTVPLGSLPFSQQLTRVEATADGLVVRAVGDGVLLRP